MIILKIIFALSFIIGFGALLVTFILGAILGPILKKHDPEAYQRYYAFWIPTSALLLLGYVRSNTNVSKLPPNKQWMLVTLKYSISIAFILISLCFLTGYIAFTD